MDASQGWLSLAACLDSDPELFFPIGTGHQALEQIYQAKAVCAACAVRKQCLDYALEFWDESRLERLLFGTMVSGKMSQLCQHVDRMIGVAGAWSKLFMSAHWLPSRMNAQTAHTIYEGLSSGFATRVSVRQRAGSVLRFE